MAESAADEDDDDFVVDLTDGKGNLNVQDGDAGCVDDSRALPTRVTGAEADGAGPSS